MTTPNDVEIRYVDRDKIYDLYVYGRFRNFFTTFADAANEAEKLLRTGGNEMDISPEPTRLRSTGGMNTIGGKACTDYVDISTGTDVMSEQKGTLPKRRKRK